jgi:hypothetical protein
MCWHKVWLAGHGWNLTLSMVPHRVQAHANTTPCNLNRWWAARGTNALVQCITLYPHFKLCIPCSLSLHVLCASSCTLLLPPLILLLFRHWQLAEEHSSKDFFYEKARSRGWCLPSGRLTYLASLGSLGKDYWVSYQQQANQVVGCNQMAELNCDVGQWRCLSFARLCTFAVPTPNSSGGSLS